MQALARSIAPGGSTKVEPYRFGYVTTGRLSANRQIERQSLYEERERRISGVKPRDRD